jgi:hypothetical protein
MTGQPKSGSWMIASVCRIGGTAWDEHIGRVYFGSP